MTLLPSCIKDTIETDPVGVRCGLVFGVGTATGFGNFPPELVHPGVPPKDLPFPIRIGTADDPVLAIRPCEGLGDLQMGVRIEKGRPS
jgi:hypothetical protein